jgi:hypothetical protein
LVVENVDPWIHGHRFSVGPFMYPHLIVKVGRRAPTGIPDRTDTLSPTNLLSSANSDFVEMCIDADVAFRV